MLTDPSRIFVRMAALSLPLAILYAALGRDRTGVMLLVVLAAVALAAALVSLGARDTEIAPPVPADAGPPATRPLPPPQPLASTGAPVAAAVAVSLLGASLVLGSAVAALAAVVGVTALAWWAVDGLAEQRQRPVNLLPVAVPVVVLFVIVSIVFFLSRILLAVPEQASTVVALFSATGILAAGAAVASRPSVRGTQIVALLALVGMVLVGGGVVAAAVGQRAEEKPESLRAAEAAKGVPLTAKGIAFVQKSLKLPAGKPAVVSFTNNDANTPHNFAVYTDKDAAQEIFKGDVVVGPITTDYKFAAPPAGTYYFRCDVHPNMSGTVTVA